MLKCFATVLKYIRVLNIINLFKTDYQVLEFINV